jgi:two-component system LytT family response regulator
MKSGLNILIVDDERPARDKLRRLLTTHAAVGFIAEARDGVEALKLLAEQQFDAVFLDMHMPELDGLSVAQQLPQPAPLIVFVTAYDQFALQAFDANAIDYLLKPYDEERFLRALQKLSSLVKARQAHAQGQIDCPPLIIQERGNVTVIPVVEIHWVEAADNYVLLHTAQASHMLRQTLALTAQRLGGDFSRCHRSYLVRRDQILRFEASGKGDGDFYLRSGAIVPCSRQYREDILLSL